MTSAGKPSNGSPKPGGARVQAALLSSEICIVVAIRISLDVNRDESRPYASGGKAAVLDARVGRCDPEST